MTLVANYVTDLGDIVGVYPMNVGNDPSNALLTFFLPPRVIDLFFDIPNFEGCRTTAIQPRRLQFKFGSDLQERFIEVPVPLTKLEIKQARVSSGALIVETIGESIKWRRLKNFV